MPSPDITYPRIILEELREFRKENAREHELIRQEQSNAGQRIAICETGITSLKEVVDKHSRALDTTRNGTARLIGQWSTAWKIAALILGSVGIGFLGWLVRGIVSS